jgi:hypothetical protein
MATSSSSSSSSSTPKTLTKHQGYLYRAAPLLYKKTLLVIEKIGPIPDQRVHLYNIQNNVAKKLETNPDAPLTKMEDLTKWDAWNVLFDELHNLRDSICRQDDFDIPVYDVLIGKPFVPRGYDVVSYQLKAFLLDYDEEEIVVLPEEGNEEEPEVNQKSLPLQKLIKNFCATYPTISYVLLMSRTDSLQWAVMGEHPVIINYITENVDIEMEYEECREYYINEMIGAESIVEGDYFNMSILELLACYSDSFAVINRLLAKTTVVTQELIDLATFLHKKEMIKCLYTKDYSQVEHDMMKALLNHKLDVSPKWQNFELYVNCKRYDLLKKLLSGPNVITMLKEINISKIVRDYSIPTDILHIIATHTPIKRFFVDGGKKIDLLEKGNPMMLSYIDDIVTPIQLYGSPLVRWCYNPKVRDLYEFEPFDLVMAVVDQGDFDNIRDVLEAYPFTEAQLFKVAEFLGDSECLEDFIINELRKIRGIAPMNIEVKTIFQSKPLDQRNKKEEKGKEKEQGKEKESVLDRQLKRVPKTKAPPKKGKATKAKAKAVKLSPKKVRDDESSDEE